MQIINWVNYNLIRNWWVVDGSDGHCIVGARGVGLAVGTDHGGVVAAAGEAVVLDVAHFVAVAALHVLVGGVSRNSGRWRCLLAGLL